MELQDQIYLSLSEGKNIYAYSAIKVILGCIDPT